MAKNTIYFKMNEVFKQNSDDNFDRFVNGLLLRMVEIRKIFNRKNNK